MWFPREEPKIRRRADPEGRAAQTRDMVTLDHVKRVADGGDNNNSNLRLICQTCNSGRHHDEDYIPEEAPTPPPFSDKVHRY